MFPLIPSCCHLSHLHLSPAIPKEVLERTVSLLRAGGLMDGSAWLSLCFLLHPGPLFFKRSESRPCIPAQSPDFSQSVGLLLTSGQLWLQQSLFSVFPCPSSAPSGSQSSLLGEREASVDQGPRSVTLSVTSLTHEEAGVHVCILEMSKLRFTQLSRLPGVCTP